MEHESFPWKSQFIIADDEVAFWGMDTNVLEGEVILERKKSVDTGDGVAWAYHNLGFD